MAKLFTMASKCTYNLVSIYTTHSPLCNLCSTKGSLQLPHSLLTLKLLLLCTLFPLLSNEHLVWLEPLLETSLPSDTGLRAASDCPGQSGLYLLGNDRTLDVHNWRDITRSPGGTRAVGLEVSYIFIKVSYILRL